MSSELPSDGRISALMVLSLFGAVTLCKDMEPLAEGVWEMFSVICNEKSETGKNEKGLEEGGGRGRVLIPYSGSLPYPELLSSLSQYRFSPNTASRAKILANPLSRVAVKSVSRQDLLRFRKFHFFRIWLVKFRMPKTSFKILNEF